MKTTTVKFNQEELEILYDVLEAIYEPSHPAPENEAFGRIVKRLHRALDRVYE